MPNKTDAVTEQLDELRTDLRNLWIALTRDPKAEARKARAWTILAGVFGAVAAMGARRFATKAYSVLTGEVPPVGPQARPRKKP
jgi:hypothetical protein